MKKLITDQQAIWNNAIVLLRVWTGAIFIYLGLSIWQQSTNTLSPNCQFSYVPMSPDVTYVVQKQPAAAGKFEPHRT